MNKPSKRSSVRIISGEMRGRRIPVLEAAGLRPTADRVRETVFNWLMHEISGKHCLDLFAGTGALGIESLSRGAESVIFVEKNQNVAASLRATLETFGAKSNSRVLCRNAIEYLQDQGEHSYDLVFLDPPFAESICETAAILLESNNWLAKDAIIYVEEDSRSDDSQLPSNWIKNKTSRVGQSRFSLYQRRD